MKMYVRPPHSFRYFFLFVTDPSKYYLGECPSPLAHVVISPCEQGLANGCASECWWALSTSTNSSCPDLVTIPSPDNNSKEVHSQTILLSDPSHTTSRRTSSADLTHSINYVRVPRSIRRRSAITSIRDAKFSSSVIAILLRDTFAS